MVLRSLERTQPPGVLDGDPGRGALLPFRGASDSGEERGAGPEDQRAPLRGEEGRVGGHGQGRHALERPGGRSEGHFGLAVRDYTHSTAPNRRFPDLITQRLLKAAMSGASLPYPVDELATLAAHCTQKEDDATKVERRVAKSAAALLLSGKTGQRFDAIVTGASAKGTWVRLFHPPVEGRLEQGFAGLDVGDEVTVKLMRTDVERGFIDFARV